MGNTGSSDCDCDKNDSKRSVHLQRLSFSPKAPYPYPLAAPPNRKCINSYLCKLEDQDIAGLDTMIAMDDKITKELGLTVEDFEDRWDNIKQTSKILASLDTPAFSDEREKIKNTFKTEKCFKKRMPVVDEYKKSVKEQLDKIVIKNGTKEGVEKMSFKYC